MFEEYYPKCKKIVDNHEVDLQKVHEGYHIICGTKTETKIKTNIGGKC